MGRGRLQTCLGDRAFRVSLGTRCWYERGRKVCTVVSGLSTWSDMVSIHQDGASLQWNSGGPAKVWTYGAGDVCLISQMEMSSKQLCV